MNKNIPANRFVGGLSNITYLTGFARNPRPGCFDLQQNNNTDQLLPVVVPDNLRLPSDKTPVTVLAHVYGEKGADGMPSMIVRAFDIQKPSVRSMPSLSAWVAGGIRENDTERFNPFAAGATPRKKTESLNAAGEESTQLREDFVKQLAEGNSYTDEEQILRDILEATRGRLDTRLGDNANVVQLAGFVDSMMWVEPNEFQSNGYGAIMLRQHEDTNKNIPVRLHSPDARGIMKKVVIGLPVFVVGQARMKTNPDGNGGKTSSYHVRINDVYNVDREKNIQKMPHWWGSMRDRLKTELAEKQRQRDQARRDAEASLMGDL